MQLYCLMEDKLVEEHGVSASSDAPNQPRSYKFPIRKFLENLFHFCVEIKTGWVGVQVGVAHVTVRCLPTLKMLPTPLFCNYQGFI